MRKWAFTKAPQVLAFSNVKGKDLTLIPATLTDDSRHRFLRHPYYREGEFAGWENVTK